MDVKAALEGLAAGFSGDIGLAAAALPNGMHYAASTDAIFLQADQPFPTASVIKLPIMMAAFSAIAAGRYSLQERVLLQSEDQVTGSGVLKEFMPGLQPTLLDLITLMIVVSDNTATNMLIDLIGRNSINTWITLQGLSEHTYVAGKLQAPPEQRTPEQRAGRMATSTPADMLQLLQMVWNSALHQGDYAPCLHIMSHQQYTGVLGRYLPYDIDAVEDGESDLVIYAKGGAIRGVRNEVGIISKGNQAFALAIMTKNCSDLKVHVDNEAELLISRLTRLLFDYYLAGT